MRKIIGKSVLMKLFIPWTERMTSETGIKGESIWAKRLNDSLCRVDNDPIHPRISYGDLLMFEVINGMPTADMPFWETE